MAQVKVLIKGYSTKEKARATISLVKDKGIIMIVDPGSLENQNLLVNKLRGENLKTKDVNYVFITHSHPDHYINAGMFPKAKIIDSWAIWSGTKFQQRRSERFTDNLSIIETPGHDYSSITLIAKTERGNVAVVGDLMWNNNYKAKDPYATDSRKLMESRKKILKIADWIVPGHGDIYKVKK